MITIAICMHGLLRAKITIHNGHTNQHKIRHCIHNITPNMSNMWSSIKKHRLNNKMYLILQNNFEHTMVWQILNQMRTKFSCGVVRHYTTLRDTFGSITKHRMPKAEHTTFPLFHFSPFTWHFHGWNKYNIATFFFWKTRNLLKQHKQDVKGNSRQIGTDVLAFPWQKSIFPNSTFYPPKGGGFNFPENGITIHDHALEDLTFYIPP